MKELTFQDLARGSAEAVALLRSLSNQRRLMMLCLLIDSPGKTSGELACLTGLSPSATSQHLARMRRDGLLQCTRDAKRVHYFIRDEAVRKLIRALKDIYCPEEEK